MIGHHVPSVSGDPNSLQVFGFLSPEENGSLPLVLFNMMVEIHFGSPNIRASRVSTLN
jgi:hypothetical protein